jgi:hypothetical protein
MASINVRGTHNWLWAVVALASGSWGCGPGDQCSRGAFRCQGDAAQQCESVEDGNGGHTEWLGSDCGAGLCHMDAAISFCALDTTRNALCSVAPASLSSSHCEGTVLVSCEDGYVTDRRDCGPTVPSNSGVSTNGCTVFNASNPEAAICFYH